jgi:hypothetical protein
MAAAAARGDGASCGGAAGARTVNRRPDAPVAIARVAPTPRPATPFPTRLRARAGGST